MKEFDLIIVGSGAGLMVMEEALNKGLSCAVIERGKMGGTCLTKGCIPSKILVYPADFIRESQDSERFGVASTNPVPDWKKISERVWEQIDFHVQIEDSLNQIPGLTIYKGTASFEDSRIIRVEYGDSREPEFIRGEKIVIATGARSFVPELPGLKEVGYLTSETFFGEQYPDHPWKSLIILGSGAISAEFAHIFSAMGTEVTLVARSGRILKQEEEEVSLFVQDRFSRDGIRVLTDNVAVSVHHKNGLKQVWVKNRITGEEQELEAEEILVAMGTESTTDLLTPEKAGIRMDSRGWIETNEFLETSQKGIYAIGDINGKFQLRHKANHEALVLSHNLFSGQERKSASYEAVPWAVFTHPQVARVGATEKELKKKGIPYQTAKNYYSEVVAGRAMGHKEGDPDNGFVKMIVGEDKKILGVHIAGPQAAALVQPFVYLMNNDSMKGYELITDSMIIHPSLSELAGWTFEKIQW